MPELCFGVLGHLDFCQNNGVVLIAVAGAGTAAAAGARPAAGAVGQYSCIVVAVAFVQDHGNFALRLLAGDNIDDVLLSDRLGGRLGVFALCGVDIQLVAGSQQVFQIFICDHSRFDVARLGVVLQGVLKGLGQVRVRLKNDGTLRFICRFYCLVGIVGSFAAACQRRDGQSSRQEHGQ